MCKTIYVVYGGGRLLAAFSVELDAEHMIGLCGDGTWYCEKDTVSANATHYRGLRIDSFRKIPAAWSGPR